MGNDTILVRQGGRMIELQPAPYLTEASLQELLAAHSALLAGAQMNPDEPRRWLLISRELGIPGESDGASRFSLDHLFLDQDAVPTLVEVKRSTDSRIRREVVGQMLDYAANSVAYLPVEAMQARFRSTCEGRGENSDELLGFFVGSPDGIPPFWNRVKTNLQEGRIRLVFVADKIPPELARVIEFLNNQMDRAEVLGIEIRQFTGQGLETYIPRLLGQTEQAKQKKTGSRPQGREWNQESVLSLLEQRRGPKAVLAAERIIDWARSNNASINYGNGAVDGSIIFTFPSRGREYYPIVIYSYGRLEIQFQYLKDKPPFDDHETRRLFAERLNQIEGVSIPDSALERRPAMDLELVADSRGSASLLAALDWFVATIQAGAPAP